MSADKDDNALFVGVDVGTQAARAFVVDARGQRQGSLCSKGITCFRGPADGLPELHIEQSSEDVWRGVCEAVRAAVQSLGQGVERVKGVGFCATCSLVALDSELKPTTVSCSGRAEHNIILWADHRATAEAASINATKHKILDYVGGEVSPEMEMPKILWLSRHLPELPRHLIELPDFLTFKATGALTRSKCSLVCKFNYVGADDAERGLTAGWCRQFLDEVGLGDLDVARIDGTGVLDPGASVGGGLCSSSATDLGLCQGTPVGASLIDAHAAALGVLGIGNGSNGERDISWVQRMAVVAGTSNCFMTLSPKPVEAQGIWGPYASAIVPGMYCNEAGQSAGGLFLNHVVNGHPSLPALLKEHGMESEDPFKVLGDAIELHCSSVGGSSWALLSQSVHMTPDVSGNRSPYACVDMTGVISGLRLHSTSTVGLLSHYIAAVQALAYGTRLVVERLNAAGYSISELMLCGGGLASNQYFLHSLADALQLPVLLPQEQEAGMLGAAMLGACASGQVPNIEEGMQRFASLSRKVLPDGGMRPYHDARYTIFCDLCERNKAHTEIMKNAVADVMTTL